ncbi:MAG TPA: hypothetical protein VLL05_16365, partial [Terriglobales bacterium]|nr:hypothetical protein [Terriglobales bacterium]
MQQASSARDDRFSAGDPIPQRCSVIEVHVGELKQLFNSIDPSPFRQRDLDREAEEFIVGWAKDLPRDVPLALVVDLDREAGLPDEAAVLRDAIHEFFRQRAEAYRRRLRELLRRGRTSLLIGLTVLAAAIALGDFLATLMKTSRIGEILRESLTIGGWVSMWRAERRALRRERRERDPEPHHAGAALQRGRPAAACRRRARHAER